MKHLLKAWWALLILIGASSLLAQTPILLDQHVNVARVDGALTSGQEIIFLQPNTGNLITGVLVNRDSIHVYYSLDGGTSWAKTPYINGTEDEVRSFTLSGDADKPIVAYANRGSTPTGPPWSRHLTYLAVDDFGWGGGAFSSSPMATSGTEDDVLDMYYPSFDLSAADPNIRGVVALHGSSQSGGEYYQFFYSFDAGQTWGDRIRLVSSADRDTLQSYYVFDLTSNATPDFQYSADGTILTAGIAIIDITDSFFRLWYSTSVDSGQTWSPVQVLPGAENLEVSRNVVDRGWKVFVDAEDNFHVFALAHDPLDVENNYFAWDFKKTGDTWTSKKIAGPQLIPNGLVAIEGDWGDDGPLNAPTLNEDGTIFYSFIDVVDTTGGVNDYRLYTVYSTNHGESWSDPVQVLQDPDYNAEVCTDVARTANGKLHVTYFKIEMADSNEIISQYYQQVPVEQLITPPAAGPIVVNEIMFDVPKDDSNTPEIEGDANGDGVRSSRGDEFIEIVNQSDQPVDISGYQLLQRDLDVVFTFPDNSILQPGEFAVAFGGVGTNGFGPQFPADLKIFAAQPGDPDAGFAGGGRSNYSNSQDNVILVNPALGDTLAEIYWGTAVPRTTKAKKLAPPNTLFGDDISGPIRQSVTRSPDVTGLWALHTAVSQNAWLYSPGGEIDSVLTGVQDLGGDGVPKEFTLHQNFPNPFNPQTSIRFDLNAPARVTLEIFNVLGKKVATLLDHEQLTPGGKHITWDASNQGSGVYYYRLQTDTGFQATRKMVFLR